MAWGRRWCSSTAGWAALASGSRSSRFGRRVTGSVAIEAYRDGTGPGVAGGRSLDDYADQVYAVAEHVGVSVDLVGFSWGGATALRVAAAALQLVRSLAVIEPEAYALLRTQDADAYTQICGLRDRWRAHVRAGRWYEAFEEFVDFYNGPGSFARWPPPRREAFSLSSRPGETYGTFSSTTCSKLDALATVTAPVHVIEGSHTSAVDHAICDVVRRHVPHAQAHVDRGRRPHDAAHPPRAAHPRPPNRNRALSAVDQSWSAPITADPAFRAGCDPPSACS